MYARRKASKRLENDTKPGAGSDYIRCAGLVLTATKSKSGQYQRVGAFNRLISSLDNLLLYGKCDTELGSDTYITHNREHGYEIELVLKTLRKAKEGSVDLCMREPTGLFRTANNFPHERSHALASIF